jgi:hypothetical protein
MGKVGNMYKIIVRKLPGTHPLGREMGKVIIVNWVLGKYVTIIWIGINWLR